MIVLKSSHLEWHISDSGKIESLLSGNGTSLLSDQHKGCFIQAGISNKLHQPCCAVQNDDIILFSFSCDLKVSVAIQQKQNYMVFEVIDVQGHCDDLLFGPWPTLLREHIGDATGIVKSHSLALGVQALNIKTLAGFPEEYAPDKPAYILDKDTASNISVTPLDYWKCAAFPTKEGSALQFFCKDRNRSRVKNVMGHANVTVPPLADEDAAISGARLAVFCCDRDQVLDIVSEIEQDEQLPHPMMNDGWVKQSRQAMQSYLISDFCEDNIDTLVDYAVAGGFQVLYHGDPFKNWGHFELKESDFPDGDISLVRCSEKSLSKGVGLGLHTLTNFTTTNDPYVSPVPSSHIMTCGETALVDNINSQDSEIRVAASPVIAQMSYLAAVKINQEILQYQSYDICDDGSIMLNNCTRGAFGTLASEHKAGNIVSKLMDHGYKIFFPDIALQDYYADRLADLFNKANIKQISFDGLEGCRYTGEDDYAVNRFCMRFYDQCDHMVINDASQLGHFLWHMHTRMNWGEPWGAAMREGMISYRIENQKFYEKNDFPRMLGWFLYRKADRKFEATSLQDIEWALAKAAGFDAGFALYAKPDALNSLGHTDDMLKTVKCWEKHRLAKSFNSELQKKLCDPAREWHLVSGSDGQDMLYPLTISNTFVCDLLEMQPGQPGGADWTWHNPYADQALKCRLRVIGNGWITNPVIRIDNQMIRFTADIQGGQYLDFSDGETAWIKDRNFNTLRQVPCSGSVRLRKGSQSVSFNCDHDGEEGPEIQIIYFTYDEPALLPST